MKKINLIIGLGITAILFSFTIMGITRAYAHCDTMAGPVVKDAQAALEKKDVTPVLKWVSKEEEQEVRGAFDSALAERAKGSEAKEKADMKFFETLVRIHRAGEGASFSGMKSSESIGPVELEADKALDSGSVDALTTDILKHLTGEVKERFDRVLEKKKHMNDSVEAGREYVEAYVEGVYKIIAEKGEHHHEE